MAQSLNLTSLMCFTFFILSFLFTQTQARNHQTLTELTDLNHSLPLSENHQNMKDEEDEQEPAFVRETGHGYGLYGRLKSHANKEEDNANENSDNDQFYYKSDAYGNRDGRFKKLGDFHMRKSCIYLDDNNLKLYKSQPERFGLYSKALFLFDIRVFHYYITNFAPKRLPITH